MREITLIKNPRKVLKRMKAILKENGWSKSNIFTPRGQSCIIGAFALAKGYELDVHSPNTKAYYAIENDPVGLALLQSIKKLEKPYGNTIKKPSNIYMFNDANGTTEEDIYEVIDKALEIIDYTD